VTRDIRAEKGKRLRRSDRSIGRIAWVRGKRDAGHLIIRLRVDDGVFIIRL
jgi:hypothetical protein